MSEVTDITWNQQRMTNPDADGAFYGQPVNLSRFQGVETVAFGKDLSPYYLVHPYQYIRAVGTRSGTPEVQEWKEICFNLYLPSGSKPLNGWPVAIFVSGVNGSKDHRAIDLGCVASMAKHGIATIAINKVGHGFGQESYLNVSLIGHAAPITFLVCHPIRLSIPSLIVAGRMMLRMSGCPQTMSETLYSSTPAKKRG